MSSSTIGQPRRRRDGEPKVRGTTRYTGDMPVHGLLHGRLVLAAEAHARLTGVDASAALAVPGVVAVLTAEDLPLAPAAAGRAGTPLARGEILWSGQPVALVVAESEAAAQDAADLVDVDTEPLEAVLDLEAAMADDAPGGAAGCGRRGRQRGGRPRRRGGRRGRRGRPRRRTSPSASGWPPATPRPRSTAPTPWSPRAFAPIGCTRATWRRRSRSPGPSRTAPCRSRRGRRGSSTLARRSRRFSACRWTACACARRRSAARSAASC